MWGILTALLSGALMSVQGVFNTEVTKQTSIWVSAGWVQLTAFLTCVAAWLFSGRQSIPALLQVEPRYMLAGGVYHLHGDKEHGEPGAGEGGAPHCHFPDSGGLRH